MDKRKNNGGHSTAGKAGRKPKADELKIIETLDADIDADHVVRQLKELIDAGNMQAIKLYFEYRYGKPKDIQPEADKEEKYIFKPIDLDII